MTALVSAFDALKTPLIRRRPALNTTMLWLDECVRLTPGLDAASQQLVSRIFAVAWQVVNTWRQADADAAQPVREQIELARTAAVLRQFAVVYGRYYSAAPGTFSLALLPAGATALVNLEGWDPVTVAAFDVTAALLTLVMSVRVQ